MSIFVETKNDIMENTSALVSSFYGNLSAQMKNLYSTIDSVAMEYMQNLEEKNGKEIVAKWAADGELEIISVSDDDFITYYFQRKGEKWCNKVVMNHKTLEIIVSAIK